MTRCGVGLLLVFAVAACGADDSSPTDAGPVFENIAGAYSGVLPGVPQGFLLNGVGVFAVTIKQEAGNLTGSYALTGALNNGLSFTSFSGTGTVQGTLAAGQNPALSITVSTPACPNISAAFSGVFDSTELELTLSGPVEFWDADCDIALTYPSEIVLRR